MIDSNYELRGLLKKLKKFKGVNFERFINKNRLTLTLLLIGAILLAFGAFFAKKDGDLSSTKIEVLETNTESEKIDEIIVEVAGAVVNPGVYKFQGDPRVEDLLISAGGVSADADRDWMEKFLNRAAKVSDGHKLYIQRANEQSNAAGTMDEGVYRSGSPSWGSGGEKLININTATAQELESLWGIGPVYAQSIIEHRPYSSVEELLNNKVIKKNVYEKNKNLLTIY